MISQYHRKNLDELESKLKQLDNIEKNMFQTFQSNQAHTLKELQLAEKAIKQCMVQRPKKITQNTFKQIVTHPYNADVKDHGNGCWMYLANFVQDPGYNADFNSIQRRALQRGKIREQMESQKNDSLQKEGADNYQSATKARHGKATNKNAASKTKKKPEIPFNLQRQLRRKQVEENKQRMERVMEYKRQQQWKKHSAN